MPSHILLVFVDGLGLPPEPLADSVYSGLPALCRLLGDAAVAVDTGLGVPGLPQSATNQTAILTGINAPALLGGHREGFPNRALRPVIEAHNIFSRLQAAGKRCTFANAYAKRPGGQLPLFLRSVTTVATLAAFGDTRNRQALVDGDAVYHDITRFTLPDRGVHDIDPIDEETAAGHLLGIVRDHHFTLFEYFLTDHAGHRNDPDEKRSLLASLDRFLGAVLGRLDPESELLLLVSDHGNIEEDHAAHSANPAPWAAVGCGAERALAGRGSLLDVTPAILEALGIR